MPRGARAATRATGVAAALCTAAVLAPACGTDDEPTFPPPDETGFEPAAGGVRRILSHEYTRSIALVLGAEAADAVETPTDIAQEGFDAIGATILPPSAEPIEIYERSAESVAEAALANASYRLNGNINIILPATATGKVSASIVYEGPIKAPIRKGDQVATLRVTAAESQATNDIPLYAGDDIGRSNFAMRGLDSLFVLAFGWLL